MGLFNFRGSKTRPEQENGEPAASDGSVEEGLIPVAEAPSSSPQTGTADLNKPESMDDPKPWKSVGFKQSCIMAAPEPEEDDEADTPADEDASDATENDVPLESTDGESAESAEDSLGEPTDPTDEGDGVSEDSEEKTEETKVLANEVVSMDAILLPTGEIAQPAEDEARTVEDADGLEEEQTSEDSEPLVLFDAAVEKPSAEKPSMEQGSSEEVVEDAIEASEEVVVPEAAEDHRKDHEEPSDDSADQETVLPAVDPILIADEVVEEDTPAEADWRSAPSTDSGSVPKGPKHAAAPVRGTEDSFSIPKEKQRRGLMAAAITVSVVALAACVAYGAGVVIFMGRFLPHTVVGNYDISLKTDQEVVEILDQAVTDYALDVSNPTFAFHASAEELGVTLDSSEVVRSIHETMAPWRWPLFIFESNHDMTENLNVRYRPTVFEAALKTAIAEHNASATPPINATIIYDEASKSFIVKEEALGTQLHLPAVMEALGRAIINLEPKLVLSDDELVQPTVFSTDEKLTESAKLATGMTSAKLSLVMAGKPVSEINSGNLSQFVAIDDKLDVTFKDDELNAWCDKLANDFNTIGKERTYTRADGKVITVSGGAYGWEIDTEALKSALVEGIKAGAVMEIEVPFITEAHFYSGAGERDWDNRYIDVDLSEQHVRFYGDDGALIWEADCISGSPDGRHNTVEGVWRLNDKASPSLLKGFENGKKIYETKVSFWMPFEKNSIGFHDATWQPSFGGAMYANGYGSHGCVNLSYRDAETLYGLIAVGDVVIVHS